MRTAAFLRRVKNWVLHANLPLIFGLLITGFIIAVAIWGPGIVSQDPTEQHYTLELNGQFRSPPYPPFSVEGFPLGTDRYGRDTLSQIFWGVRPTLLMVGCVALVRLVLGLIIGLAAGWASGRKERLLELIISVALAIPVLFIALIGITLVGIDKGLPAFIFGLALTGWADTARIVNNQTRTIKDQVYVEMSKALGATSSRTLFVHVMPQILPMVFMLLAFEFGSTLLVVAELAFLGFFIGGGIWVEVSDFVAVNITALPELGQFVATSLYKLTEPSTLLVAGTFLFLMILGFNLLGEGLRIESNPERRRRRKVLPIVVWMQEKWNFTIFPVLEDYYQGLINFTLLAVVVLIVGLTLRYINQPGYATVPEATPLLSVPGGHYWATERHDAQGTRYIPFTGPQDPSVLWKYAHEVAFSGGPVVRADGVVILAGTDNTLVALNPDGSLRWKGDLPRMPVGTPALDASGGVYVVDVDGGLTYFTFDSPEASWTFTQTEPRHATSGPVVSSENRIYYTLEDRIQAVSSTGEDLFRTRMTDLYIEEPPRISPQGTFAFLQDGAIYARSGGKVDISGLTDTISPDKYVLSPKFFVGADEHTYLALGHGAYQWHSTEEGLVSDGYTERNISTNVAGGYLVPNDIGLMPSGLMWLFYSNEYINTVLYGIDFATDAELPSYKQRIYGTKLFATDPKAVAYLCGNNYGTPQCFAVKFGNSSPEWTMDLDGVGTLGGALAPGRLYVTTNDGLLFALGDDQQEKVP
jgi:ABC-type dipeptide/oligopeptide/nickel transport system permease subunit/outer membrane protein assembly factor BamB